METFRLVVIYNDQNKFTVEFDNYEPYARVYCDMTKLARLCRESDEWRVDTMADFQQAFICCSEQIQRNRNVW